MSETHDTTPIEDSPADPGLLALSPPTDLPIAASSSFDETHFAPSVAEAEALAGVPLTASDRAKSLRRREWVVALLIFITAFAARAPMLRQSLWNDELGTVKWWAQKPVSLIVQGKTGEIANGRPVRMWVPNNQVLHTLLVKGLLSVGKRVHMLKSPTTDGASGLSSFSEPLIRAPAAVAGSLLCVIIAWPLRRRRPWEAVAIALILAFHPWLIAFSIEARGYTLMLCFAALCTNLLPVGDEELNRTTAQRWLRGIAYAICAALAMYTVPIALMVFIGHAVAMLALQRNRFVSWMLAGLAGAAITLALYFPLLGAISAYFQHPYPPTITQREFFDQLPRYAVAGYAVASREYLVLPIILILGGALVAIQNRILRPAAITFLVASLLAIAAAAARPVSAEVRFVPWLIPLFAIALIALVSPSNELAATAIGNFAPRRPVPLATIVLLALYIAFAVPFWNRLRTTPPQPLREAVNYVEHHMQKSDRVAGLYLSGPEALWAYSTLAPDLAHQAYGQHQWSWLNNAIPHTTPPEFKPTDPIPPFIPRERYLIVCYEFLTERDEPAMWETIRTWYHPVAHFDGRIAPTVIYERNTPAGPDSDKLP